MSIMLYDRKANYFGKALLVNFIRIWKNSLKDSSFAEF